jgi:tripartite-type tricarboxylate transporter receptor subunit TctC
MTMKTRMLVALAACLGLAQPAQAQAPGDKPIRFLVGFPAGAASDTLTRMLAERLRAGLNQTVITENRTGAAGRLAAEALKAAPPDGSTLLLSPVATAVIFPISYKTLRYDPFKDFAPVAHIANFQIAFAIANNVPAKTLTEYVALVKRDPKFGNYGSAAAGSIPHFFGVMFAREAKIELTHVPYRGTAPVLTDLVGGQVNAGSLTISDIGPLHKAGKVRAIATSGAQRSDALSDVPTFREQGIPIEGNGWFAVYTTAGTPGATIDRYNRILVDAVRSPEMREWFAKVGLEGTGSTPESLAATMRADFERWGPPIRASGFTPDD